MKHEDWDMEHEPDVKRSFEDKALRCSAIIAKVLLCLVLYFIYCCFAAVFKLGAFGKASPYTHIALGAEVAVERAIFIRDGEYEATRYLDKWYGSGNKKIYRRELNFCRVLPDGEIQAVLPDSPETPWIPVNCHFIAAYDKVTDFKFMKELSYKSPYTTILLYYLLNPFVSWVDNTIDVLIPGEYLDNLELYGKILDALKFPCKYAYKDEIRTFEIADDSLNYKLCRSKFRLAYRVHILNDDIDKASGKTGAQSILYIKPKKIGDEHGSFPNYANSLLFRKEFWNWPF